MTSVIVVGVVQFKDKLLLLKRTPERETSPNKWNFVSGYLEPRETCEEAVIREIKEETGLDGTVKKAGEAFTVEDPYGRWIIVPFLVSVESDQINLDKGEHSEFKWIKPEEIKNYDCVGGIEKDLEALGLKLVG